MNTLHPLPASLALSADDLDAQASDLLDPAACRRERGTVESRRPTLEHLRRHARTVALVGGHPGMRGYIRESCPIAEAIGEARTWSRDRLRQIRSLAEEPGRFDEVEDLRDVALDDIDTLEAIAIACEVWRYPDGVTLDEQETTALRRLTEALAQQEEAAEVCRWDDDADDVIPW